MEETQKNLLRAFAGESMARTKYTLYAQKALEEGYRQIAEIFDETADNERAHAERLSEFMEGPIETSFEFKIHPIVRDTLENLRQAAAGERYEWSEMYPAFKRIAEKERKSKIAAAFQEISEVEELHEARYKKLANNIKNHEVFKRKGSNEWKCRNCGYVHKGKEAPKKCPACDKDQTWYELRCTNW
jgi:rubrerythrin